MRQRIGSVSQSMILSVLLLALSIAFSSCNHRDFDFENNRTTALDVIFDWVNEPEASPKSMSLFLFPQEGGIPFRFDFGGRDGGTIEVKPGVYHAVCINNEERGIAFRGEESHLSFEVFTIEASTMEFGSSYSVRSLELPRANGTEGQLLAQQPPLLWAHALNDISITYVSPKSKAETQRLVMTPKRIVDTYMVTVKHINNARYLHSLNATVSDLADGYFPAVMAHNDNKSTIPHELSHNVETADAHGMFLTFGHCANASTSHRLMLYTIMTNGSKYYYEYDVSDQMHLPPDADNIHHITIDLLDLPDPIGGGDSGGGFNPEVKDWETVNIHLPM